MTTTQTTTEATTDIHSPAQLVKFLIDNAGNGWLCDKDIGFNCDLEAENGSRCDEMAIPTGGR